MRGGGLVVGVVVVLVDVEAVGEGCSGVGWGLGGLVAAVVADAGPLAGCVGAVALFVEEMVWDDDAVEAADLGVLSFMLWKLRAPVFAIRSVVPLVLIASAPPASAACSLNFLKLCAP